MHGNDFEHDFRRLYSILNHIESYTKLPTSSSKVNFSIKSKVPELLKPFLSMEYSGLFNNE